MRIESIINNINRNAIDELKKTEIEDITEETPIEEVVSDTGINENARDISKDINSAKIMPEVEEMNNVLQEVKDKFRNERKSLRVMNNFTNIREKVVSTLIG